MSKRVNWQFIAKRRLISKFRYQYLKRQRKLMPREGKYLFLDDPDLLPLPATKYAYMLSDDAALIAKMAFSRDELLLLRYRYGADDLLMHEMLPDALQITNSPDSIERYGILIKIDKINRDEEKHCQIIFSTVARVEINSDNDDEAVEPLYVSVRILPAVLPEGEDLVQALSYRQYILQYYKEKLNLDEERDTKFWQNLQTTVRLGDFADLAANNLKLTKNQAFFLLIEADVMKRLQYLVKIIRYETGIKDLQKEISHKLHAGLDRTQRNYYIQEQIKVLQNELNSDGKAGVSSTDHLTDEEKYLKKLREINLSAEYADYIEREIRKLAKYPFGFPEAAVLRDYLELVFQLPWGKYVENEVSPIMAQRILDADYYGLTTVKQRILEYIGVMAWNQHQRADNGRHSAEGSSVSDMVPPPVLCLVGPPGVGKTSIAKSIAKALGRKYIRMSLGGLRDEAEIRGHRRTYIGAMPGRFIQAMCRSDMANPLILLDEIDKLAADYRGDPTAALLEILDPQQNNTFIDHYLDIPFDFSHTVFITTANSKENIPWPLLDRLEIIELPAYNCPEKLQIAKKYLWPQVLAEHGLEDGKLGLSKAVMETIITNYTHEAGVRNLRRKLGQICRRATLQFLKEPETIRINVTKKLLPELLGKPSNHHFTVETGGKVGIVNGLAWTAMGGVLLKIEVSALPGKGEIILTGNLGQVMQESAKVALAYIRSKAAELNLPSDFYCHTDIHIHALEGAVPKDGPSAGITLAVAMISALTGVPVRSNIAMTGEISLHGDILPIGGLSQKIMAAELAGVVEVYIPQENFSEIESDIISKTKVKISPVNSLTEVWRHAKI